jgi:hypothetical protein
MMPMNTQPLTFLSRASLERAFAGVLFSATAALVAGGALMMALRAAFAV